MDLYILWKYWRIRMKYDIAISYIKWTNLESKNAKVGLEVHSIQQWQEIATEWDHICAKPGRVFIFF